MALVARPRVDAVVLGGGGIGGAAWMLGLLSAMRADDIDVTGEAGAIVATSAGAITAAILTEGARDIASLGSDPQTHVSTGPPTPDYEIQRRTLSILSDININPANKVRRIAQLLKGAAPANTSQLARINTLLGTDRWPVPTDLRIVSTDLGTAKRRVWTRHDTVSLASAVAASHTFPGAFPPVVLDGHWHADGGLYSDINADLTPTAGRVLIVRPFQGVFPDIPTPAEAAVLNSEATLSIGPDFNAQPTIRRPASAPHEAWRKAFASGLQQAPATAITIKDWLNDDPRPPEAHGI